MYPASQFGVRSTPRASTARLLSLAAVLVLFFASMAVFVDMRPGPGHFVGASGLNELLCPRLDDGGRPPMVHLDCNFVAADPRIPQRMAVGFGAVVVAVALFVTSARMARRRDELDDPFGAQPARDN